MKYLALEITDQKIRYIFFYKKGNEFVAQKTGSIGHTVNPVQKGLLSRAISEILDKEKLSASRIFLTISRRDTIIHQITLPRMPKSELEEVIPGEIEKISVFSDKEFEYIYQIFDQNKEKIRVVFGAIKENLLRYIMDEIGRSKLKFSDIELAPLNLIGIFAATDTPKEDQALIVVDERTTYLIVHNKNEYKYIYSTHTGIQDIYFAGTAQANKHSLSILADELNRVYRSYLLETRSEPFTKVQLIWDNAAAPSLNSELAKALNIQIENFPLDTINGIKFSANDDKLNPIDILCATPVIYVTKNIKAKFPFSHFFQEQQMAATSFAKVASIVVVFVLAVGIFFSHTVRTFNLKAEENNSQAEEISVELEKLTADSQKLFKEKEKYVSIRDQLLGQATYVSLLKRMSWSEVLGEVSSKLPKQMALTSFKVSESGQVNFNGEAFKMESVSDMIRNVDISELIHNGRFSFLREKLVDKQKIYTYGVFANLKLQSIQEQQAQEAK